MLFRHRLGVFRVGLAELWQWFWVAIFFVQESWLEAAASRQALVFRFA